jgi:hypothetical protein
MPRAQRPPVDIVGRALVLLSRQEECDGDKSDDDEYATRNENVADVVTHHGLSLLGRVQNGSLFHDERLLTRNMSSRPLNAGPGGCVPSVQISAFFRRKSAPISARQGRPRATHAQSGRFAPRSVEQRVRLDRPGAEFAVEREYRRGRFDRASNHRIWTFYSVFAALFLATQEPFSSLAAKRLSPVYFVCLIALLLSIPLLTLSAAKRRDFLALLSNVSNLCKLAVLFAIGLCSLLLYNVGLSNSQLIFSYLALFSYPSHWRSRAPIRAR